jgi:hypothetical protein
MTPSVSAADTDAGTAALLGSKRPWMHRERAARKESAPWLPTIVLFTPLLAATFLAKAAIPPYGEQGIGISLPLVLGLIAIGLVAGCVRIQPVRLTLFLLLMAFLGLSTMLQPQFSMTSLILVVVLHLPYVFYVEGRRDTLDPMRVFLTVCAIIAWLAIAQYVAQFAAGPRFAFPIENFVPKQFVVQGFNAQGALEYGSSVYRATGVFLYEPSYLSQLLAVAIVAQLCTTPRWGMLALFAAGMLVSYSGTGVMILAVCLPLVVIAKKQWSLLFAGLFAIVALVPLAGYLHLDHFIGRAGEMSSSNSSGFARFVGGFYLFDEFLWGDIWHALFGFGTGSFRSFMLAASMPVAEMPLFKMVMECGVIGATLYFLYLFYCVFATPVSKLIALAIAMTFLLNGLYSPFSHCLALTLLVWPGATFAAATQVKPVLAARAAEMSHATEKNAEGNLVRASAIELGRDLS